MLDNENVLDFVGEVGDASVFDDREPKLQRLVQPGHEFLYLYDFGDSWRRIVKVEAIETRADPMYSAIILDGKRAGPAEDVGGPGGYAAFLDTITKRGNTDEAMEYLEWWKATLIPRRLTAGLPTTRWRKWRGMAGGKIGCGQDSADAPLTVMKPFLHH